MRKVEFYSRIKENGKDAAKKQSGWSDGKYYYYLTNTGKWCSIHPDNGYSMGEASTLSLARDVADDTIARLVNRLISEYEWQQLANEWQRLIIAAKLSKELNELMESLKGGEQA